MKLLRYGPPGQERPGLLDDEGRIRDLSAHVDDIAGAALSPEGLARIAALEREGLPIVSGQPRLGPCVGDVRKFVAIGLNYADHAAEAGLPIPAEPVVFSKWSSCIAGPDDDVVLPPGSQKTDWEVELGVVIGSVARRVAESAALEHVAGYCVVNDLSEREWQAERGGSWDKGKGFDGFGPIGPWLVTRDEVAEVQALELWLELDGRRMQQGSTARMIFGVAEIVAYCSRIMTLLPGDVITTGTPPGVGLGMKPPMFLRGGEIMRLGISGLGEQCQRVRCVE
jgi:ureidoglycolate lyase